MNQKIIFLTYLNNLAAVARQGDAREESFYPTLADMLKEIAHATGKTDVHVTTLPRPTEGGNPDFRLWNGTDRIIGYVEAKKPTEERLDIIEKSEQLKRYRATFPNLILTNFLEFRLYRNGAPIQTVQAGRPLILNCDKWLKDRKERRLSLDDIRTYCRMVTAIGLTLTVQQELDLVYAGAEGNCVTVETK